MFEALASVGSGLVNNLFAADRQADAQDYSARMYANRYQTTVRDMKNAGLNPMLAYSQGVGSAPTSSAAGSAGMSDIGQTMISSKLASAQVANIAADTENKQAQADLIQAQVDQTKASASSLNKGVEQMDAAIEKIREEIKNVPEEGRRLRASYIMLAEQAALMGQQGETEVSKRKNLAALTAKALAEGAITRADYDAIIKTDGIGRIAREVKPISDIGADWLSPKSIVDKLLKVKP